jgi:CBS domain containing-hemolysin-like protein
MTLFDACEELLHHKEHVCLVADEYEGINGITTLEHVI